MPSLAPRLLLALLACASLARAQAPAAGTPGAVVIAPDKPFALEEAIALALQKSFNLQIQAIARANAKDNVTIQEAGFDPTLTANVTRSLNQSASTTNRLDGTAAQGPRNDNTVMRAGVSLPRVTATNGTLSLSTNVSRAGTNSVNSLFNPAYANGVSATLNQPLLRDFGREAALSALENARLAFGIASTGYRSAVLNTVATPTTTSWLPARRSASRNSPSRATNGFSTRTRRAAPPA